MGTKGLGEGGETSRSGEEIVERGTGKGERLLGLEQKEWGIEVGGLTVQKAEENKGGSGQGSSQGRVRLYGLA